MAKSLVFDGILAQFPRKNFKLLFAYGSGVFEQKGNIDKTKNMLDFIFAVDNPTEWHQANMEANPSHYSIVHHLGAKAVSYIQENMGAGVYFNTLVPCSGRLMKYGVISTQALMNDLLDWEMLYVSGRLHKPVLIVHQSPDQSLNAALSTNLQSAVHTALLLQADTFTP